MSEAREEYNNLKIHTQYSICEGAIKIDDLANYCKTNKIKAIGLADSNNLCGALEFAEKISKVGTQPIIGTQINVFSENTLGKITLYATSEKGYKNLTKLSSLSYLQNKKIHEPYCEIDDLITNNEDIIILTGNYRDFFGKLFYANKEKNINQLIKKLAAVFNNRLYIEIQRHQESQEINYESFLFNLSSLYDLPLIASQEVYYMGSDMAEAHDALICIGEKLFIDDPNRFRFSKEHFLKTKEEIKEIYKDIPEALENNYKFPTRFNFKPKKSKPILPTITNNRNISPVDELTTQAKLGLDSRLKNFVYKKNNNKTQNEILEIYKDRLDHELDIINSMDYSSYFPDCI